jgi:hypothetical protein
MEFAQKILERHEKEIQELNEKNKLLEERIQLLEKITM